MRLATSLSLGFLFAALACPAAAGPVRLEIETAETPRDPFVVTVTGHYADLHNGYSRTWKHALVPAGRAQWLPLGPVNWLLNMGVSLRVSHPEYVGESQRSRKTPLLVRPVFFEPFRPRAWRDVMAEWPTNVEKRNEHPLFAVLGHLQGFLHVWLPTMDAEGSVTDAQMRTYLPFLDELLSFAEAAGPAPRGTAMTIDDPEKHRAYERSLASQELEARADAAELVRRAHAWLSVPRSQRVALRTAMEDMGSPKGLAERRLEGVDEVGWNADGMRVRMTGVHRSWSRTQLGAMERLSGTLATEDFLCLAEARRLEMRVGALRLTVPDAGRTALRYLAGKIPSATPSDPAAVAN